MWEPVDNFGRSTKLMRAIVVKKFGPPKVLKLRRNVPIPRMLPTECLVKVAAIGVNPADDLIRSGKARRLPQLPYIPGTDVAGTVVDVGYLVKDFKVGDRVASFMNVRTGAYAEYCCVDPDWLLHLRRDFDFRKGACLGTAYCMAYRALFHRSHAKPGDTILVHGAAGGMGMAVTQIGALVGMRVIGTAGTEAEEQLVADQGSHQVMNHKMADHMNRLQQSFAGDEGPDVILELLSNVNLNRDLELVAPSGSICIMGAFGDVMIKPRMMLTKEATIYGIGLAYSNKRELMEMKCFIEAAAKLEFIRPMVGAELGINQAWKAHKNIKLTEGEGAAGKFILVI